MGTHETAFRRLHQFRNLRDELISGTTTSANDIQQVGIEHRPKVLLMLFWRFIIFPLTVRHSCVGIGRNEVLIPSAKALDEWNHLTDVGIAVDANGE